MKQKKVLLYLKHKQADLAFIQETHLKDDEAKKFKRDWVGQVYYSSFSSKKNGVLILVHKRLNLSMVKEFKDANGRIICIETVINGMQLTLITLHTLTISMPPIHKTHLFSMRSIAYLGTHRGK